jgi:preprotein translocase subunit SecA
MSFINSIIKAFVGDKSEKMLKASALFKQIKTFLVTCTLSHDELRGLLSFFKDQ